LLQLNIPNKNLVIFNFQSNEFQFTAKNDEISKSETGMPEIQNNSLIPKSVENNSSGNNNNSSSYNNNNSNTMNSSSINSSNSNNMSMMNKLSKKKVGIEKTGMDSKHILGKVSKTSKNIMKIPSKYQQSKNLYNKNKNSIGMGSGSTTISNETTVMTSGQVGSHYQNANSSLYSHPSSNSSLNQSSNNSSNTSGVIPKYCAYCGTRDTPMWRRGPEGAHLCNACGVKWKSGKILTPMILQRTQK